MNSKNSFGITTKEEKVKLGKRIKKVRTEVLQMTQAQLAEKLHVSRKTVNSWENGVNRPSIEYIELIIGLNPTDKTLDATWIESGFGKMFLFDTLKSEADEAHAKHQKNLEDFISSCKNAGYSISIKENGNIQFVSYLTTNVGQIAAEPITATTGDVNIMCDAYTGLLENAKLAICRGLIKTLSGIDFNRRIDTITGSN